MTVPYVAAVLGVSAAALGSMEVGQTRISAEAIGKLCALLKIRPAEIFDDRGLFTAH